MTIPKNFRASPIKLSENIFNLQEGVIGKDIQLLKVGKFFHDGEEIDITQADLESMVTNFSENVRGIDLMLDYSHESEGRAAAWFKNVYLSENDTELWTTVEWTPSGESIVKEKEFRYISADFSFNYEDNETRKTFGPTLLGAGLTNRPVIKRMQPTTLSEKPQTKDIQMTELEKAQAELAEAKTKLAQAEKEKADIKLSEEKAKSDLKLAEENTAKEKVLSEKKGKFDKKLSEGTVCEAQRDAFMKDNMDEFMEKAVPYQKKTEGNGNADDDASVSKEKSSQAQVMELAEKMDKKISLSERISTVLRENKKLNEGYKKETSH